VTTQNIALYRLLVKLGASEGDAEAAAALDTSLLATKQDLSQLKAELIMWQVGIMVAMTGIFAAIVKLT
jgi:hypothetical protein